MSNGGRASQGLFKNKVGMPGAFFFSVARISYTTGKPKNAILQVPRGRTFPWTNLVFKSYFKKSPCPLDTLSKKHLTVHQGLDFLNFP